MEWISEKSVGQLLEDNHREPVKILAVFGSQEAWVKGRIHRSGGKICVMTSTSLQTVKEEDVVKVLHKPYTPPAIRIRRRR